MVWTADGDAGSAGALKIATSIADVDVHPPLLSVKLGAVLGYMPRPWRERLDYLGHMPLYGPPGAFTFLQGASTVGVGAELDPEISPAAGVELLRRELLDPQDIGIAQIVAREAAAYVLQPGNYDSAAVLASAFNDYILDQWITDDRLRYAIVVGPSDPALAAREIERLADDPRVSAVWLPAPYPSLGGRAFTPVHEAAARLGLPILVHPSGIGRHLATPAQAFEGRAVAPSAAWQALASVIAQGVCERHRGLRFLFAECGFSWLPDAARRMDAAWASQKHRLPELARSPSDVIREQVRFSTHPLDDDRTPEELAELIVRDGGLLADVLVFGGNHPQLHEPAPDVAFGAIPGSARRRIMRDNAETILRTS